MSELRVGVVGLGPIGLELVRAILGRGGLRLCAVVDAAPALAGRSLAELLPGAPELRIAGNLSEALEPRGAEAIALTTTSRFASIVPDLETAIRKRVHVVSTGEELASPAGDAKTWARIDDHARHADVTILGTGVNPGFVMDRLPLQLAGACVSVERVRVERVVDAAQRRGPLRTKVGAGMSQVDFGVGAANGKLGHVGLHESVLLIANGLHWRIERYHDELAPAIAPDGTVLGIKQRAHAWVNGEERITLSLDMYVGAPEPHDRIVIDGDPPLDVTIAGGTHGDRATVGTALNALARMRSAPRGLVTVADVFA